MPLGQLNFRDLGGIPASGGLTRRGVLFRSEGPTSFGPGQAEAARALGIRSIFDLRSSGERTSNPHAWQDPGCRVLELAVNADLRVFGNDGRNRLVQGPEEGIAIDTMVDTYREIPQALLPHWRAIGGCLIGDGVPVLINCTAGKDRTGVAVAVLLELIGAPRDAIMADYLRSAVFGENLKRSGALEAGLMGSFGFLPSTGQIEALIGVREEYLEAAWDVIARNWGGVDGYLRAAGLERDTLEAVTHRLVETKG